MKAQTQKSNLDTKLGDVICGQMLVIACALKQNTCMYLVLLLCNPKMSL